MSFKIRFRRTAKGSILLLSGSICGRDAIAIREKVLAQGEGDIPCLAVDLGALTFIDSHGLGVLVWLWKQLEADGKEMVFVNPGPFAREMLEVTNLDKLIRTVGSVDEL